MADNDTSAGGGSAFSKGGVDTVDLVVIIIYLALCMATGIWVSLSLSCYFSVTVKYPSLPPSLCLCFVSSSSFAFYTN